jgi:M6 family metalloprotease-like protein
VNNHPRISSVALICVTIVLGLSTLPAQVPDHASALKDLNRQLLEASADGSQKSYAGTDSAGLRQLLSDRRSVLATLISENPSEALTLAFPPNLIERLVAKYPRHADLLESRSNWQGISESLVADNESLELGRAFHFLKIGTGTLELHFAGREPAELTSGSILNVGGVRIGNVVAVQEGEVMAASTAKAAGSCGPTGAQSVVVILANLPGYSLPSGVNAELMKGILRGNAYTTNDNTPNWSVGDFWEENSDGQTWVEDVRVVGPYTLSSNYNSDTNNDGNYDCQYSDMRSDAIDAADGAVNFNDYDRVVIVFPKNTRTNTNGTTGGCSWAGLGSLGCWSNSSNDGNFTASIAWLRADQTSSRSLGVRLGTHELGHNLGLLHGNIRDFGSEALGPLGDEGTVTEYGDRFSTMGTWNFGFYSAQHATEQLGWLNAGSTSGSNVRVVESNGSYTIQNYEARPAGQKALKIRRGTGNNTWLWAELRQATGIYDAYLIAQVYTGALMHYEDSYTGTATHLADFTASTASVRDPALAAGESWSDPYSDLTLSVDSVSANSMTMTVTYGNSGGCLEADPAISLNPTSETTFAGVPASLNVSVTNQDGAGCGSASFNLVPTVPQGWTATASPASLSLDPGQSGNATLSIEPSGAAQPASYGTSLVAAHPNGTNSASAAATVHIEPTVNDLAVTSVTATSVVTQGDLVSVFVGIQNVGNVTVSDNITVTLDDQTDNLNIGSQVIAGLAPGASQTLTFAWNTATAAAPLAHSLQASQLLADSNAVNDTASTSVLVNEPLSLTGLAPNAIAMGTSTAVAINGTGFESGAVLECFSGTGPQPSASNVVVVNSTTITASVQVGDDDSTDDRNWNVRVTNPGGATATFAGVLTVLGDQPQNAAPQVSISSPANNASYTLGDSVAVSGSASDAEDGDLTANLVWTSNLAGTIGNGAGFTWPPAVSGTHIITASVVDSQGEPGNDSVSVTINVDAPPILSIDSPSSGASITLGAGVGLAGTATDDEDGSLSHLISWSSSLEGTIGTGATANWTPSVAGAHIVTASVADSQGQSASDSVTISVDVDDPPSVSIDSPSSGTVVTLGASVGLAGSATDDEDGNLSHLISWSSSLEGAIGTGASSNWTPSVAGSHVVTASVNDSNSQSASASVTIAVNIDSAPTIAINSPVGQPSFPAGSAVSLLASANDNEDGNISHLITWSSNVEGVIGTGGSTSWTPVASGFHIVTASVTDSANQAESSSTSVTVNPNSPPVLSVSSPSGDPAMVLGTSVSLTAAATDVEDGNISHLITWISSLEGSVASGANATWTPSTLGLHLILVSVTDSFGETATATARMTVTSPNSAPSLQIILPAQGASVSGGIVTVIAGSTGGLGNRGVTGSAKRAFSEAAPESPEDQVVPATPTTTLSGSAFDPEEGDLSAAITWSSDVDGPLGTGAILNVPLTIGVHVVTATVSDSLGMAASASVTFTVQNGFSVTISAYKRKGRHRMDITWLGATGEQIEIHRWGNASADIVTLNDGQYLDAVNERGRREYFYQLCEIGALVCSDVVPVVF